MFAKGRWRRFVDYKRVFVESKRACSTAVDGKAHGAFRVGRFVGGEETLTAFSATASVAGRVWWPIHPPRVTAKMGIKRISCHF